MKNIAQDRAIPSGKIVMCFLGMQIMQNYALIEICRINTIRVASYFSLIRPDHQMLKRAIYLLIIIFLTAVISLIVAVQFFGVNLNQTVLEGLMGIKEISKKEVNWRALDSLDTYPISHGDWNTLTARHVTQDGRVDYRGFWSDSTLLKNYLALLSQNPPNSINWNDKQKIAYWINAYNAFTVKLILDHYPVKSIKDLGGGIPFVNSPWDIQFFKLGGIDFDLNTIEHEILRKEFDEPRIHFAINCASKSCPKLRNEAFTARYLDFQLEEQTQDFLLNESKNLIGTDTVLLSPIFDWFNVDFVKKQSLPSFLNQHYADEIREDVHIEHMEYDWTLNE